MDRNAFVVHSLTSQVRMYVVEVSRGTVIEVGEIKYDKIKVITTVFPMFHQSIQRKFPSHSTPLDSTNYTSTSTFATPNFFR